MNEQQKSSIHHRIIEKIDAIRDRHEACTAEAVARDLKLPVQNVKLMCGELRQAGLVDWTHMPGSLRTVTPLGEALAEAKAELSQHEADTEPEGDASPVGSDETSADQPSKLEVRKGSPKKRAAKKKAAASSRSAS